LLISDGEHPGIVAICQEISRRCGVVIDTFPVRDLPTDHDILQSLKDHLQPQTRMVCLSHIIWNTGQVMPLQSIAQLCHKQDVLVAVDAAQSVGVLPLDLTALEIDYYAFTAHKWWCAPLGVGGLYVRPQVWEQSHATYIGWRGLEFGNRGAKFEVATSTYPLYCGLRSALAQSREWGSQSQRYDRLVQMAQSLWRELQAIPRVQCLQPQPPLCGLVTFTVDGMSSATLSQALEQEHRIHVRAMAHPDCLRASVHYLNSTADLDRLLSVLQKFR
jgi:L-cysteine/cystine lyase